jgi:hypothetical protein
MLTDVEARLPTCRRPALFGIGRSIAIPIDNGRKLAPILSALAVSKAMGG